MESRIAGRKQGRLKRVDKYLEIEDGLKKLEDKMNSVKSGRGKAVKNGVLTKSKLSGSSDRLQRQQRQGGGESSLAHPSRELMKRRHKDHDQDGSGRTAFRFSIDFGAEKFDEEWDFASGGGSGDRKSISGSNTRRTCSYEERVVPANVINQSSPSDSEDENIFSRGPRFTYTDRHPPLGLGDETLSHSVPILGLRSPRSSSAKGRPSYPSLGDVLRSQSYREPAKSPVTLSARPPSASIAGRGKSAESKARSRQSKGTSRPLSAKPSTGSSKTVSGSHTRASSCSSRTRISRRSTKTSGSRASDSSRSSSKDSSSDSLRIPISSRSRNDLPEPVFPFSTNVSGAAKMAWSGGAEAPGRWETVIRPSEVRLGNTCVWALTDPPEPPPGIHWKEVTPPAPSTPVPQSEQEPPDEHAVSEGDEEGAKEEEEDDASSMSSAVVPELVPSADPIIPPPVVIRKVVMPAPEQVGYPGFCDSSEALRTLKSKRGMPSKNVGVKKKQVSKEKNNGERSDNRFTNCPKDRAKVKVMDDSKKSRTITPTAWKSGLKWAKRESKPMKSVNAISQVQEKNLTETSEKSYKDDLSEIRKFVNETENKISVLNTHGEIGSGMDVESPEIPVYSNDSAKHLSSGGVGSDAKSVEDFDGVQVLSSLADKHLLEHVISKEDGIKIDERNYSHSNDDDMIHSSAKAGHQFDSQPISSDGGNVRKKSAVKLNNAFQMEDSIKIHKKPNSLSNFPKKIGVKPAEVVPGKCLQQSRQYDPKMIKDYIRIQKQLRHKKIVEEKERKRQDEEKKRAKLLDLRSKSKELVEVSVKRRSKVLKKQLENLQHNDLGMSDVLHTVSTVGLTEKSEMQKENWKNQMPPWFTAEMKQLSDDCIGDITKSDVMSKPVCDAALQTGDSLVELEFDNTKNNIALESDKLVSSLRLPTIINENNSALQNPEVITKDTNFDEKHDSSKTESLHGLNPDRKILTSIQREVKKLARNVYLLEKYNMIDAFPDRPIPPPNPMQRNEFETTERQSLNLKNTNSEIWDAEKQPFDKHTLMGLTSTPMFCSNNVATHNSVDPWDSVELDRHAIERTAPPKSSANNLTFEDENSSGFPNLNALDTKIPASEGHADGKKSYVDKKEARKLPVISSPSSSMISEGPLQEEDVANLQKEEIQLNNACDNPQLKQSEEKKKNDVPFWLKNLSMESRQFNFISAVKMKLNRFLEEQNEEIAPEDSPDITPPPKLNSFKANKENLSLPKSKLIPSSKFDPTPVEQEAQYDSDFETSTLSSTLTNPVDPEGAAADSSDLDTATEDILPTDKASKPDAAHAEPKDLSESDGSETIPESKKSKSNASIKSIYSLSDYKLVLPKYSLSQSSSGRDSRTAEIPKPDEMIALSSDSEKLDVSKDDQKREQKREDVLSTPSEILKSVESELSFNSGKEEDEMRGSSKLEMINGESTHAELLGSVQKSTAVTVKSVPGEDLSPSHKVMLSNASSDTDLPDMSDRSHPTSVNGKVFGHGLHIPVDAKLRLQPKNKNKFVDAKVDQQHQSMVDHHSNIASENAKNVADGHVNKLAEMERKAFEHRIDMEKAFENERLKLELALEEAKRTVFDSKLEASKFISDAAVEMVKTQAVATKANAEATKHLSEAKIMSSLKLETISAQTASAAAFAAVQAAMQQLQKFGKMKHGYRRPAILEDSLSSDKSDTTSRASEGTDGEKSMEKGSEHSANVLEDEPQEIAPIENKSDSSIPEDVKITENGDISVKSEDKSMLKPLEGYQEHSSVHTLSDNTSEHDYSLKFDDMVSETGRNANDKMKEDRNSAKHLESGMKRSSENTKVVPKRIRDTDVGKSNLDSTSKIHGISNHRDRSEHSSNSDGDSFTNFSLSMFQQLMRGEEIRAQHQQALLKLRDEALVDKTKAEMTLLELKKKISKEKGQEDVVSSIRKKQRGLLIRLQQERDEIQRLMKLHKTASHERRMMLTQQQHIIKMRTSTKEIINKLPTKKLLPTPKGIRSIGFITSMLDTSKSSHDAKTEESLVSSRVASNDEIEEQLSLNASNSDVSHPTELSHSSRASVSDSESHKSGKSDTRLLEKRVLHGLDHLERNKKFLSEREKNLIHRRQAVEELLLRRKRLELEEEKVSALESKAFLAFSSPILKSPISFADNQDLPRLKADKATSPLHEDAVLEVEDAAKMTEDVATSTADVSSAQMESILEDLPNQSQKSSQSVEDEVPSESKNLEQISDQEFESQGSDSDIRTQLSVGKQSKEVDSSMERETMEIEEEAKSQTPSIPIEREENVGASSSIQMNSPLASYFQGRQKRRHSSGSDDSIVLSLNETASEQSDIEGKICALQEQLRKRKMRAELLKKEQKRCRRERLKDKEQSLLQQIRAYDLYIEKAQKELQKEYEPPPASAVKPQIKHRKTMKKKVDEPTKVLSDISDQRTSAGSLPEVTEKVSSLESMAEKTENSVAVEPLADAPKTPSLSEFHVKESDRNPMEAHPSRENGSRSPVQNKSSDSLAEVMEEIPSLAEEFPSSRNSPLPLSRGSSLETTIESPTKQDNQADPFNDRESFSHIEGTKSPGHKIQEASHSSATPEQNAASKLASDNYDEDTFENTSDANGDANEIPVENPSDKVDSPVCLISEEIVEELSCSDDHEHTDHMADLGSNLEDLTPEKVTVEEVDEVRNREQVVGDHEVSHSEQTSDELISLPTHVFVGPTIAEGVSNETYVLPAESIVRAENEERIDEIAEDMFVNLFEESVVEAEILRNKNSVLTSVLSECGEKVADLTPLYDEENYNQVDENKFQFPQPDVVDDLKVVSTHGEESSAISVAKPKLNDKGDILEEVSKKNIVSDSLMDILLEDAISEALDVFDNRESYYKFEAKPDFETEGHNVAANDSRNSDILKRVQQIMLESSMSQASPREKSRPQDLMITTYDVLSPENSSCNSPVLGHSEMEMIFNEVEKMSQRSPQKYQGGKAIQFLQVEHGGGLGATSNRGESSGGDNEAFSQDWFEEDFGLNSSLREVEEIQQQQLQIEREIEQLQLQQASQQRTYPCNFYIREIPNKPPPPYTPPEETPRITVSSGVPISPLGALRNTSPLVAIPTEHEEVADFVQTISGQFYDCWSHGESLDMVELPLSLKSASQDEGDSGEGRNEFGLQKKSRRLYFVFLFDLTRQIVDEVLDNVKGEKWPSRATMFGCRKFKPILPFPSRECFVEEVVKQACVILGFFPKSTGDSVMYSWIFRKRNRIEEILIREVQEEDSYWTDFDEEEKYLKEQIAESLFEVLLTDASRAVATAYERRARRLASADS